MPVRSLNSPVLKWPDRTTVDAAVRGWATELAGSQPGLLSVGYFGSYARGDWGVGSDLDIVVVIEGPTRPFEERARDFDVTSLPVPADVLVYTPPEWSAGLDRPGIARTASREMVWIFTRDAE